MLWMSWRRAPSASSKPASLGSLRLELLESRLALSHAPPVDLNDGADQDPGYQTPASQIAPVSAQQAPNNFASDFGSNDHSSSDSGSTNLNSAGLSSAGLNSTGFGSTASGSGGSNGTGYNSAGRQEQGWDESGGQSIADGSGAVTDGSGAGANSGQAAATPPVMTPPIIATPVGGNQNGESNGWSESSSTADGDDGFRSDSGTWFDAGAGASSTASNSTSSTSGGSWTSSFGASSAAGAGQWASNAPAWQKSDSQGSDSQGSDSQSSYSQGYSSQGFGSNAPLSSASGAASSAQSSLASTSFYSEIVVSSVSFSVTYLSDDDAASSLDEFTPAGSNSASPLAPSAVSNGPSPGASSFAAAQGSYPSSMGAASAPASMVFTPAAMAFGPAVSMPAVSLHGSPPPVATAALPFVGPTDNASAASHLSQAALSTSSAAVDASKAVSAAGAVSAALPTQTIQRMVDVERPEGASLPSIVQRLPGRETAQSTGVQANRHESSSRAAIESTEFVVDLSAQPLLAREALLAGIAFNADVVDRALEATLAELEQLGGSLAEWLDDAEALETAALVAAFVSAGGIYYYRCHAAQRTGVDSDEPSNWLWLQLGVSLS